jgi:hypothetical protein
MFSHNFSANVTINNTSFSVYEYETDIINNNCARKTQ